jgi:nucleoside-diphosphate-sugar epimerase
MVMNTTMSIGPADHEVPMQKYFAGSQVLVTGGMGFLGANLVAKLIALGAEVTLLDLDASPQRPSLINDRPGLRSAVQLIEGDVGDFELVRQLFRSSSFRAVFNLASFASVIERAVDHPYQTIRTSAMGLVNILESVRTSGEPPLSVVHTSTDKVYGDANGEPYDEERTPLRPEGVYDVAKMAADALAHMYSRAYACPTVVLRLCNVIGPGDHNTSYRVAPRAMKAIFGGDVPEAPTLYAGSAHHERDYIYVDDCIRALLTVAAEPLCRGKIYNLTGCAHLKTPEILQALVHAAAQVESEEDQVRASTIRRNAFRVVGEPPQAAITISSQRSTGERLKADTGFSPAVSLAEALLQTARFYRQYFDISRNLHVTAPSSIASAA